jgi:hypothetical protein
VERHSSSTLRRGHALRPSDGDGVSVRVVTVWARENIASVPHLLFVFAFSAPSSPKSAAATTDLQRFIAGVGDANNIYSVINL